MSVTPLFDRNSCHKAMENAMANEDDLDDDAYCEDEDEFVDELEDNSPPTTKLERRRRIEQMAEDKKLMEELSDFDF